MDTATIKEVLKTILDYIKSYTEAEVVEDAQQAELQIKYQDALTKLETMTKDSQELASLVTELQAEVEKLKNSTPTNPVPPVEPVPPTEDTVPGA